MQVNQQIKLNVSNVEKLKKGNTVLAKISQPKQKFQNQSSLICNLTSFCEYLVIILSPLDAFHCIGFGLFCVVQIGLCDHLRDAQWEDIFIVGALAVAS